MTTTTTTTATATLAAAPATRTSTTPVVILLVLLMSISAARTTGMADPGPVCKTFGLDPVVNRSALHEKVQVQEEQEFMSLVRATSDPKV